MVAKIAFQKSTIADGAVVFRCSVTSSGSKRGGNGAKAPPKQLEF